MLGPVGHIGGLFAYLATARRQHASDRTTARQCAWSGSLPPGLELTWLGTAGFRLAHQDTVVWIDPYVTRLSLCELTCDHVDELSPQRYRCGQVWGIHVEVAGTRIYHQGSADLIEDEIHDRGVDLFLCGISGRRFTPRYIERIVRVLQPARIVPIHHDDLFRPLDAPARFSFNVNLTGFADEVRRASRDLPIATLDVGVRIT